jgi:hypothetical protein
MNRMPPPAPRAAARAPACAPSTASQHAGCGQHQPSSGGIAERDLLRRDAASAGEGEGKGAEAGRESRDQRGEEDKRKLHGRSKTTAAEKNPMKA